MKFKFPHSLLRGAFPQKVSKNPKILHSQQPAQNSKIPCMELTILYRLRFQPKLGHVVNHCQCNKIGPNLPKIAKISKKSAQRQLA
jgi:hypothetical protein